MRALMAARPAKAAAALHGPTASRGETGIKSEARSGLTKL